jgi:uroporphyrinogen-III synthase
VAETDQRTAAIRLPLLGKRVMVTRPEGQNKEICAALREAGAEAVVVPLIQIVPLPDFPLFDAALEELAPGDWIFLTSQNAVAPISARVRSRRPGLLEPGGVHVAAVGPSTADKARSVGLRIDFIPSVHTGVAIAEELGARLRGRRVLLPRSDKAGADLPEAIRFLGGEPLEVIAYRTESNEKNDTLQRIAAADVDAVTVFSPTEMHVLKLMATAKGLDELQSRVPIVAIGEVTAQACRNDGVKTPLVAAEATVAAMIEALSKHFAALESQKATGAKNA